MKTKLTISSHAQKQFKKLPKAIQIILAEKIRSLANLQNTNSEKLRGYTNFFRTRAGNYRIVYIKLKSEIEIVTIGHRKDVYLKLTNLLGK